MLLCFSLPYSTTVLSTLVVEQSFPPNTCFLFPLSHRDKWSRHLFFTFQISPYCVWARIPALSRLGILSVYEYTLYMVSLHQRHWVVSVFKSFGNSSDVNMGEQTCVWAPVLCVCVSVHVLVCVSEMYLKIICMTIFYSLTISYTYINKMYFDHIHHLFSLLFCFHSFWNLLFFNHIFLLIPCLYLTGFNENAMMGSLPVVTPLKKSDCSSPTNTTANCSMLGGVCMCGLSMQDYWWVRPCPLWGGRETVAYLNRLLLDSLCSWGAAFLILLQILGIPLTHHQAQFPGCWGEPSA